MSAEHKAEIDHLTRRIADCLEAHLPEFGFEPYRYPSGENKSIDMLRAGEIQLYDANGGSWVLTLSTSPGSPTHPTTTDQEES